MNKGSDDMESGNLLNSNDGHGKFIEQDPKYWSPRHLFFSNHLQDFILGYSVRFHAQNFMTGGRYIGEGGVSIAHDTINTEWRSHDEDQHFSSFIFYPHERNDLSYPVNMERAKPVNPKDHYKY